MALKEKYRSVLLIEFAHNVLTTNGFQIFKLRDCNLDLTSFRKECRKNS